MSHSDHTQLFTYLLRRHPVVCRVTMSQRQANMNQEIYQHITQYQIWTSHVYIGSCATNCRWKIE